MTDTHDPATALWSRRSSRATRAAPGTSRSCAPTRSGCMQRVRDECGDVGEFRLADQDVVLLTGAEANEVFFRATDEELDQAAAYPFMTPIFGEGVVFDASPERRREQLHNMALRDKQMRGHAETIQREVDEMVARWDDAGEIDLLDWFAELTIYTSSSCLIGRKFRLELDHRFAELYHDLEQGTDAIAYVDPYADIPSFHARDAARRSGWSSWCRRSWTAGAAGPPAEPGRARPARRAHVAPIDEDGRLRFDADHITGMFISMMFAGHHTTSGTAAWTLIELLRHPDEMAAVVGRARRAVRRRHRGQLPGAARDAPAGGAPSRRRCASTRR